MDDFPVLLDIDETCARLRCKKDWLYDQVRLNRIPHVRIGRPIYFLEEDLARWLRESARSQAPR